MNLKTYTMMVGNLSVTAQVTENGCIPVSESIVGSTPGRQYNLSPILTQTICTELDYMYLEVLKKKNTLLYSISGFIHMGTSFTGITPGISDPTVFNPPVSCMMGPIYPAVCPQNSLNITNLTRDSSSPCKAKITKWLHKPTHSLIIEIFLKSLFSSFQEIPMMKRVSFLHPLQIAPFFLHLFSYSFLYSQQNKLQNILSLINSHFDSNEPLSFK